MKILITGATGFIGQELIRSLQYSYEIVALVRQLSDVTKLEDINCKIIRFNDHDDIINVFIDNNFSGVIHLASNIVVEHNTLDIKSLVDSNIIFGTFLLEASKHTNVKWFINTGTFWQNYENEDYNPVNLYAATKEAFQAMAKYYTQTSDLIFTTLKLNDTFGPNDTRPKIFNLWNNISKSGEVLAMSKGEQIIDISYIEDIVNAYKVMILNLNSSKASKFNNETFVVSNKYKLTLRQLSKLFEEITKRDLNINWGGREYRQREVMSPYSLGKPVPGWEQQYTLEEAIRKTIKEL